MEKSLSAKKKIAADVTAHLSRHGMPLPSLGALSEGTTASRQLIRYYFEEPSDMLLAVCDCLAEGYRMALVQGVADLQGPARLDLILDFYFDLVAGLRKPRDDLAYDAMMACAGASPKVQTALREQYTLLGQLLALEIKIVHAHLTLDECAEISFLFTCLMYGHWKMVATLGLSEDHKRITRRAVDRIIQLYAQESSVPKDWPRPWQTQG